MGALLAEREGSGGAPVHCFHHRLLWETASEDSLLGWSVADADANDELGSVGMVVEDIKRHRSGAVDAVEPSTSGKGASRAAQAVQGTMRYRAAVLLAACLSGLARDWFPSRMIAESPDWFLDRYSGSRSRR